MNAWLKNRALISVGLTVTACLLLWLAMAMPLMLKWKSDRAALQAIESRVARMQGLIEVQPQMDRQRRLAEEHLSLFLYSAHEDVPRIGNDMQQRVRQAAAESGLAISRSQVMPAVDDGPFIRAQVAITAQGDLRALADTLAAIELLRPVLLVDQLQLQPQSARAGRNGHQLVIQMRVSAWKVQP